MAHLSSVFCVDCKHDANHHFGGGHCSYCNCERNPLQILLDRITELEAAQQSVQRIGLSEAVARWLFDLPER